MGQKVRRMVDGRVRRGSERGEEDGEKITGQAAGGG